MSHTFFLMSQLDQQCNSLILYQLEFCYDIEAIRWIRCSKSFYDLKSFYSLKTHVKITNLNAGKFKVKLARIEEFYSGWQIISLDNIQKIICECDFQHIQHLIFPQLTHLTLFSSFNVILDMLPKRYFIWTFVTMSIKFLLKILFPIHFKR